MIPLAGPDPVRATHGPTRAELSHGRRVEPVQGIPASRKVHSTRRRRRPGTSLLLWEGLTFAAHLARLAGEEAPSGESPPPEEAAPDVGHQIDVTG